MKRRLPPLGLLEAAALALTVAACVGGRTPSADVSSGPPAMSAAAVSLDPANPARDRVGALRYLGGYALAARGTSTFHGLSAIEASLAPGGGVRFLAVSDEGEAFAFSASSAADRWRVEPDYRLARLRGPDGEPLGDRPHNDAEGLAASLDGDFVTLSFERRHRLQRTTDLFDRSALSPLLPAADFLAGLRDNGGIEGLAELPLSGRVVLALGAEDGRIWFCDIRRTDDCRLFHARSPYPGYSLTALDHLPGTADLVALYRAYDPIRGMRTIVARIVSGAAGGRPGDVRELARLERPLTHENFEGVAAVGAGPDRWTLWLISDDGFPGDARTLLLAFDYAPASPGENRR